MSVVDKVKTLKALLEALKANGVTYNTKRVDSRLKIQKLVYLAQIFGVSNIEYEFNRYLRGAYSEKLAEDYYRIDNVKVSNEDIEMFLNDERFRKLVKFVKGKSGRWLEIAVEIIETEKVVEDMMNRGLLNGSREDVLVNMISNRKLVKQTYVKSVLNELRSNLYMNKLKNN